MQSHGKGSLFKAHFSNKVIQSVSHKTLKLSLQRQKHLKVDIQDNGTTQSKNQTLLYAIFFVLFHKFESYVSTQFKISVYAYFLRHFKTS